MFSQTGGTIGVTEGDGGQKSFMPIVAPDPATGRRRRGETNPQGHAEIELLKALFPGKSDNEIIEKCRSRETGWSGRERTRPDGSYIMSDGDMLHQWLDRPEGIMMRRDIICQDNTGATQRSTSREEAKSAGPSHHVRRQFDGLTPEQKIAAADAAAEVVRRRENDHEKIVRLQGINYNPTSCRSISHLYALGRAEANADWMLEQTMLRHRPSLSEREREREEAVAAASSLQFRPNSAQREREREEAVAAVKALTSAEGASKKGGRTKRKRKYGKLNKKKKSRKTRKNKRKKSRKTRGKKSRK